MLRSVTRRFGYVSPSSIELPWELQDMLPDGVGVIATTLHVGTHEEAEFRRALDELEGAVEGLAREGAEVALVGGVPLAARLGHEAERDMYPRWSERVGVPVLSTLHTTVLALAELGAHRPVVATGFRSEVNELLARYLTDAGVETAAIRGLEATTPADIARLAPSAYAELARALVAEHPEADAVLLGPRRNIHPMSVQIEDELGLPVVYGGQAGLWWALRELGVPFALDGYGRLLSSLR